MDYRSIAASALAGRLLSRRQCRAIMACPSEDILQLLHAAYLVRRKYHGDRVHIQMLSNVKSGHCPEDCHYCSQSSVSRADIEKHSLLPAEKIVAAARLAKRQKARRYCMALSGSRPSDREIAALCRTIRRIKEEVGISLCCSIGFLSEAQARDLRRAGLDRVNHNLNTSPRFYPRICTTHRFAQRVANLERCRRAGLEICSGGIVGQGETADDVIDLLLALKKINPESIPLNFLIPIPGTPFADRSAGLTPIYCLKVLALARLLHPDKDIRIAGGREHHLRALQPLALYAVNSIFVAGYLTTGGQSASEALRMISDAGFSLDVEGTARN